MSVRRRVCAATCVSVTAVFGANIVSAQAYVHNWSCTAYAASQCYDYQGVQYNSWQGVKADVGDYVLPEVCAKGITAASNIRAGSGCASNAFQKRACFSGGTPDTWGYVYWAGGLAGPYPISGRGDTSTCP